MALPWAGGRPPSRKNCMAFSGTGGAGLSSNGQGIVFPSII
jgi:hypothetical protein